MNFFKPGPSFGENIGSALGQGLSALMQHKMQQQLQKSQQSQKVRAYTQAGVDPNMALALTYMPEKAQATFWKDFSERGGGEGPSQQEESQNQLQQLMQSISSPGTPQTGMKTLQQAQPQIQQQPDQSDQLLRLAQTQQPSQTQQQEQPIMRKQKSNQQNQSLTQQQGQQLTPEQQWKQMQEPEAPKTEPESLPIIERKGNAIKLGKPGQKSIDEPKKTFQEELAEIDRQSPKYDMAPLYSSLAEHRATPIMQRQTAEERKQLHQDLKAYNEKIDQKKEAAIETLPRLDKIEKLTRYGYLGSRFINSVLKSVKHGIGGAVIDVNFDYTGSMPADAQELEKESIKLMSAAVKASGLGSKITQQEYNTIFSSIPSLMQSNKGRMKVLYNSRNELKADLARAEAKDIVMKAYNNRPPKNFKSLVEKVAAPKIKYYADKFVEGFKTSPESLSGFTGAGYGDVENGALYPLM